MTQKLLQPAPCVGTHRLKPMGQNGLPRLACHRFGLYSSLYLCIVTSNGGWADLAAIQQGWQQPMQTRQNKKSTQPDTNQKY